MGKLEAAVVNCATRVTCMHMQQLFSGLIVLTLAFKNRILMVELNMSGC